MVATPGWYSWACFQSHHGRQRHNDTMNFAARGALHNFTYTYSYISNLVQLHIYSLSDLSNTWADYTWHYSASTLWHIVIQFVLRTTTFWHASPGGTVLIHWSESYDCKPCTVKSSRQIELNWPAGNLQHSYALSTFLSVTCSGTYVHTDIMRIDPPFSASR